MFKKNILIFVLIFINVIPFVFSEVGVYVEDKKIELKFEPGLEYEHTFYFFADGPVIVSAEGDFNESATFDRTYFPLGPKREVAYVRMKLKLPEEPTIFGVRTLSFTVTEKTPEGGGAVAKGAVKVDINIVVPYPGKYLEGKLRIPNAKVDELAEINLDLLNVGTETIENVYTLFEIWDGSKKIGSLNGETISIPSKERATVTVYFDTKGLSAGIYTVRAFVNYDEGKKLNLTDNLKIGDIIIKIINYTRFFEKDKISPFDVNITSLWNEDINGVYAKIDVFENSTIAQTLVTPTVNVKSWKDKILTAYIDTTKLSEGEHDVTITVYYSNKTAVENGVISVQKVFRMPAFINTSNILISIVIILVIINLIILVLYAKKKNKEDGQNKTQ